ncbi:MAG: TolC family protein, partial [Elusimicrobiota bacterium]
MTVSREDLGKYYGKSLKKLQKKIPALDSEHVETHLNVIRTADMVWKAISAYLRPYGLTPPAMGALIHLYTAGEPTPMGRISEQMVVTQANVTGIVDTLEKAGLVERVPHPKDRRITLISITPAGNKKIKSFLPGQMKLISSIYGVVPKKEQSALRRTLERIRERVKGLLALALLFWAGSAAAKPLTIKSAVETALRQNHQLAAERAALDSALSAQWAVMAQYDISLAVSVRRLDEKTPPAVFFQVPRTLTDSGSASLAKRFSPGTQIQLDSSLSRASDFPGSTFTLNPRVSSSFDLSITQPLLKGLVGLPEKASLRASEIAVKSALARLDRAAELLAQRTTASYWEFWRSQRNVVVLKASEEESREFLSTTRKLMKRFEAEKDDLLRAEASLLRKQLEVLEASERVEERIEDLREKMNAEAGELRGAELSTPTEPDGIPILAEA